MSGQEEPTARRWHDDRGELSRAIELLAFIPPAVLPLIADALCSRADREFNAGELLKSLKSLGRETILALHQAQLKRRSYDQSPELSKIVNTLFILPDADQEMLAVQFLAFCDLMVDYMAFCDSFEQETNPAELAEMCRLFVETGAAQAQSYLQQIHQSFYARALGEETDAPPHIVVQTESGLRIHHRDLGGHSG